jgi:hypothetical protein
MLTLTVTKILKGHVSPETAYVVDDYPYGYTLRCKIRYWLEVNKTHGVRFVSQTTNPKRGHIWNKPKASTYARFGACMFLDEQGHVCHAGLTEYSDAAECARWLEVYGEGNPIPAVTEAWHRAKVAYEAKRDAARAQQVQP